MRVSRSGSLFLAVLMALGIVVLDFFMPLTRATLVGALPLIGNVLFLSPRRGL